MVLVRDEKASYEVGSPTLDETIDTGYEVGETGGGVSGRS